MGILSKAPLMEWNKTYSGGSAHSVQQTNDGGYVFAGGKNSDLWLVKTDANGNVKWSKTYGGTGFDTAYSVQQTTDEGYIVAGRICTDPFIAQPYDGWLVKTDSNGNMEWNRTYGRDEWGKDHDDWISWVQQTSDGGYIFVGTKSAFIPMDQVWLVKTDANGTIQWEKTFGGSGWNDFGTFVQQTSDGGFIVAGYTQYSFDMSWDFWLIKTNENGTMEWNKTFGGSDWDAAYSVQQTMDEGFIIAGYTRSFGAEEPSDAWLIKTDAYGNMIWNKTYSGGGG